MTNNCPTLRDVYTLDSGHYVVEEGLSCPVCGEPFEVGQRAVEVPFDPSDKSCRMMTTDHLHCAVMNDEIVLTPPAPQWHKFDKDDESTWPDVLGFVWVHDTNLQYTFEESNAGPYVHHLAWNPPRPGQEYRWWWKGVTHWMPIEVPEPPDVS